MSQPLGDRLPRLQNAQGKELAPSDALRGKVVALYCGASWCPPCREFSPLLEEFAAKHGDDVAVVFVSHDHDERSFEQYSAHMPHVLRIPWSEFEMRQNISAEYGIYALPTLQIVGPDGASITNWGRAAVMRNPDRCVEAWKNGKSGASFLELLGF